MSEIYNADIHIKLEALEVERKQVAKQYIIGYCIMALGALLTLVCVTLTFYVMSVVAFFSGLIIGFIIILLVENKEGRYRLNFKHKIIGSVVGDIASNLQIDPKSGIGPRDFVESFLFAEKPDLYKTEDLVYGEIGKTAVSFAEVRAQYLIEGKPNHIFSGILFCASFNKHFDGLTLVRPRQYISGLSKWISQNLLTNAKAVELENANFNSTFFTQASDQVEARYILTPSLIEKLLVLNHYADSTISVSFVWSNIYIAFPMYKNYFEAPIFRSLLKKNVLEKDLNILRLMCHVVEELDLNTRIWTKQ